MSDLTREVYASVTPLMRRRSAPGTLRFLAGKLRGGAHPESVALVLEMLAEEMETEER